MTRSSELRIAARKALDCESLGASRIDLYAALHREADEAEAAERAALDAMPATDDRLTMLSTYTFEAPAHWASAFINGDASGLSDEDCAELEEWAARHEHGHSGAGMPDVLDCSDSPYYGFFHGLMTELCTYTAREY